MLPSQAVSGIFFVRIIRLIEIILDNMFTMLLCKLRADFLDFKHFFNDIFEIICGVVFTQPNDVIVVNTKDITKFSPCHDLIYCELMLEACNDLIPVGLIEATDMYQFLTPSPKTPSPSIDHAG